MPDAPLWPTDPRFNFRRLRHELRALSPGLKISFSVHLLIAIAISIAIVTQGHRNSDPNPSISELESFRSPIVHAGVGSLAQNVDDTPFRFDEKNYSWLRGIATFDDRQNLWRIQYGTEKVDLYKGQLSIAHSEWLSGILNGDVVLLEGRIDLAQRGSEGKPKYVLSKPPRRLTHRSTVELRPRQSRFFSDSLADPERAPGDFTPMAGPMNHLSDEDVLPRPLASLATGSSSLIQEGDDSCFGFDEEHHSWLRGIANYDDRQELWRIQYCTPEDDFFSGQLSIANSKWMSEVLNGDIVLLEGRIDPAQRDSDGKPKYVLSRAPRRLVPKPGR